MNQRRDIWGGGAIFIAGLVILPWHLLGTPIRWDFIRAYGSDVLFIFRWSTITHNSANCLLLGALWLAGWGVGRRLLRALAPDVEYLSTWAASLLIGWGILSHSLFLLAVFQKLALGEISFLLGLGCAIGLWELWSVFRSESISRERRRRLLDLFPRSPEGLVLVFVCLILLVGSFVSALMPPTQSDALRYHLTTPKLWLQHGGFYRISHISFSNFPMTIEMLFAVPLAFDLASVAKLIHWSLLLATLGMIYQVGKTCAGRTVARLGVVLFVTIPFVPILASWAFVEMGLCAYLLLTVAVGLEMAWRRPEPVEEEIQRGVKTTVSAEASPSVSSPQAGGRDLNIPANEKERLFFLSPKIGGDTGGVENNPPTNGGGWRTGILLGLAGGWLLGCKYTGLIYLFIFLLMLLLPGSVFAIPRFDRRKIILAGFVALVVASPWYVKNLIYNENPVYPMGTAVFGEREWTKANAAFFSFHAGLKGDLNAAHYLSFPGKVGDTLRLVIEPLWSPIDIGVNDFGDWPVSALFVILLPPLLFGLGKSWPKRFLAVYGGILFVVWAWTYRDARFLLAPFCILAIPLSMASAELWSRQRLLRVLVMLIVVYYGLWNVGKFCDRTGFSPWKVVSGFLDEDRYLRLVNQTTRTFYHGFEAVRDLVPPGEKVLIHGQHYTFHCPRPFLGADWFDTPPLIVEARRASSVSDLVGALRAQRISYVLHDKKTIERYNESVAFPAYWLLCLPPGQAAGFIRELRDLEPARRRDPIHWEERVRKWRESVHAAIQADPGWRTLQAFWESPSLETVYEVKGMRLARIRPRDPS